MTSDKYNVTYGNTPSLSNIYRPLNFMVTIVSGPVLVKSRNPTFVSHDHYFEYDHLTKYTYFLSFNYVSDITLLESVFGEMMTDPVIVTEKIVSKTFHFLCTVSMTRFSMMLWSLCA